MSDFDYKRAWAELYAPAALKLPKEIVSFAAEAIGASKDCRQDHECKLGWPDDDGKLRARFEGFDDLTLARAAEILHAFGHSAPSAAPILEHKKPHAEWAERDACKADKELAELGLSLDVAGQVKAEIARISLEPDRHPSDLERILQAHPGLRKGVTKLRTVAAGGGYWRFGNCVSQILAGRLQAHFS